jgi:GNAT superfamily N-acetyltransferase
MAVLPAPASTHNGPRPIKPHRDATQVVALLSAAFELPHHRAQTYYDMFPEISWQSIRHWWQGKKGHPPGFVWEEERRIVGNVSFLPINAPGCYLIANVGVHPDFRRRGIAHGLMETTIAHARTTGERTLFLQVDEKNVGAIHLYEMLGFTHMQGMTSWRTTDERSLPRLSMPPLRRNPDEFDGFTLQQLPADLWQAAYALDTKMVARELGAPYLLPADAYQHNWRNWWRQFWVGVSYENWAAVTPAHDLIGLGQIRVEWGRPYLLKLRFHPEWQEVVARPLIAKLLRRLSHLGRRAVHLPHPSQDLPINALLSEATFTPHQTLLHMRLDLAPNAPQQV